MAPRFLGKRSADVGGCLLTTPTERSQTTQGNEAQRGRFRDVDEQEVAKIPSSKRRGLIQWAAQVPEEIRKTVRTLTELFWPGPLTLILPKNEKVPDIVSAGLPTVGVRCSQHEIFSEIVETLGRPLAAPSANRFGRISPTSADAVMSELDGSQAQLCGEEPKERGFETGGLSSR